MLNVLRPRDLVSRPDNMDETVPHTFWAELFQMSTIFRNFCCTFQDKLSAKFCKENILSTIKEIEDIREMPLSESRSNVQIAVSGKLCFHPFSNSMITQVKSTMRKNLFRVLCIMSK